jgi:hypothetical protein
MIEYTGNSAYCYANSLHMCLQAAGADPLPDTGLLEALTLMPFGGDFNERESGPVFHANLASMLPDKGLTVALQNLGWRCATWSTQRGVPADEALEGLSSALEDGPALLGPLDMGHLSYNPRASRTDHYIVAFAIEGGHIRVHDPQGFPFAALPISDLIDSWRAEWIGYAPGAFTFRSAFHPVEALSWGDVVSRALVSLRETLSSPPPDSRHKGGPTAFRRVAALLRSDDPPDSLRGLQYFALPMGARRCQDGARLLAEAGVQEAAKAMEDKARLYGSAQYHAVKELWPPLAETFDQLAEAEEAFTVAMT